MEERFRSGLGTTPIRLGPVEGRLVAEVFASLLRGDQTSYLYAEPTFRPIPDFTRRGTSGWPS